MPAIWEEAAKQEMENASIRAGMVAGPMNPHASPHPIIIVLEPEAASLYSSRQEEFKAFLFV